MSKKKNIMRHRGNMLDKFQNIFIYTHQLTKISILSQKEKVIEILKFVLFLNLTASKIFDCKEWIRNWVEIFLKFNERVSVKLFWYHDFFKKKFEHVIFFLYNLKSSFSRTFCTINYSVKNKIELYSLDRH